MGRRPRSVGSELIQNTRSRRITYEKRKQGLEKKAYELSTLCDVKICIITYGPKENNGDKPIQPTIWPEEPDTVRSLINAFMNTPKDDSRSRNIDKFYEERTRSAEEELAKLLKVNSEAKYSTWDEHYQTLSYEELTQYHDQLDTLLHDMNRKIELMKITENHNNYNESSMLNLVQGSQATQLQNNLYQTNNMELEIYQPEFQQQQHNISSFSPFMADQASFYNSMDVNSLTDVQMMMAMLNNNGPSSSLYNCDGPSSSLYNCDYASVSGPVEINGADGVNNCDTPFWGCVPGMNHLHSMPFQMPPYPLQSEFAPQMHSGFEMEKNGEQIGNFGLSELLDHFYQMRGSEMEKNSGDQMGNFN